MVVVIEERFAARKAADYGLVHRLIVAAHAIHARTLG